jgi:hypothetical protein
MLSLFKWFINAFPKIRFDFIRATRVLADITAYIVYNSLEDDDLEPSLLVVGFYFSFILKCLHSI